MRLQGNLRHELWAADADTTAERLLANVRELAPDIQARATEFESARRLPLDLVEKLKSIGVFRMFVPRTHGGFELDLPAGLKIIAALSRIEGSVGWTAMIGSAGGFFTPSLPRPTYEQVYRNGPDVIVAGSIQPTGKAERITGGWRVSGRWPFASGCQHADWMVGFCVMYRDGEPVLDQGGRPCVRGVFLPERDWRVDDTWHAAGLKGTGSHHIAVTDVVVPDENLVDLENGTPCEPGPLYQAVPQFLPMMHGAFSTGTAEGALDDLLELVHTGRQQLRAPSPMRDSEIFQFELGRIEAEFRAAQAAHEARVTSHWRHALAGTLRNERLLTQGTQTGIWVTSACVRVVDACFTLAGGSAVYESSPLQRRMRDIHAAAQHATVQRRHYLAAGKAAIAQFNIRLEDSRRGFAYR